ncbi:hypothetical protein DPMN_101956 [Dreissena polymorpha]|uniref:G-protein coupled receptors family 1 profile domain-containing protein n=2 Tax=Dreissena polymorpha TaxID=45954 RepID=A0A9D4LJN3_DREPO|nr:hypothetical protein DPMN_101956 [Dreissena polymorpha]
MLNLRLQRTILPVILFIGIVALVGIIGNVLILIIYGRRRDGGNFRCFVLMMATIDLTSCITISPGEIYILLNWYDNPYIWICKAKTFFNVFTSWGSAWILFLLAIDRYRKICRPLRWQITTTLAMKLCILALVISAAVASWVALVWGKYTYEQTVDIIVSVNVSVCDKTYLAHRFAGMFSIGFVFIFPVGISLLVLLCLNSITSITLFRQRNKFKKPAKAQDVQSELKTVRKDVSEIASVSGGTQPTSLPDFSNEVPVSLPKNAVGRTSQNESQICCIENINVSSKDQEQTLSHFSNGRKSYATDVQRTSDTRTSNSIALSATTVREERFQRMKQKTIIMLVLTVTFVVTMFLYVVLISFKTVNVLNEMPDEEKVLFFFFLRLYFLNTIVNPFVYGIMDERFRNDILDILNKLVNH